MIFSSFFILNFFLILIFGVFGVFWFLFGFLDLKKKVVRVTTKTTKVTAEQQTWSEISTNSMKSSLFCPKGKTSLG